MDGELDLGPIKARCEKATAEPWRAQPSITEQWGPGMGDRHCYKNGAGYVLPLLMDTRQEEQFSRYEDAEFIAHARSDIPALIEELEQVRDRLKEIEIERSPTVVDCRDI